MRFLATLLLLAIVLPLAMVWDALAWLWERLGNYLDHRARLEREDWQYWCEREREEHG